MSEPVLRLEAIEHAFAGAKSAKALDGLSLELFAQEILCLLGPSGCGKTTSLLVAAGIERPDKGRVLARDAKGKELVFASPDQFVPPEKRGIGLVFQDYALFPHMNLLANTAFGLKGGDKKQRAQQWLEKFSLGSRASSFPHELSGGEQQRAALARAMAPEPDILLLDEPFSSLDRHLRLSLREEIRSLLKNAKTSAIFVTHDPEEAMRMGDRVALMREGHVVQAGTPATLYDEPVDSGAARFFGEVNLLAGNWREGKFVAPPFEIDINTAPPETALLMARPEIFSLQPPSESGNTTHKIEGTILDACRAGSDWVLKLRPHNSDEQSLPLIVRPRSAKAPAPGEKAVVFYNPEKLRLLPA